MSRQPGNPRPDLRALTWMMLVVSGLAGGAPTARADEPARLSDAAKETAKSPAEQRTLHVDKQDEADDGPSIAVFVSGVHYEPRPTSSDWNLLDHLHVGAVASMSRLASPEFAPSTLYGFRVGLRGGTRTAVDLFILGGQARFTPGSDIDAVLRRPRELAIEGSARYSLNPGRSGVGVAPVVGLRVGHLAWTYLHGIWVEHGGLETNVSDDHIAYYAPYLGLEFACLRSRHLELGVTALTGWRYYDQTTSVGLRNDLFGQDRFNELRLETRVVF